MSFISYLCQGLDLAATFFGEIVCIAGILTFAVCIVCAVLGFIKLRKGNPKKAVAVTLVALGYCLAIIVGYIIDDVMHTIQLDKSIAEKNEQLYGQNWDAAPAIEGIPELYQEVLNKYYVAVRDRWPSDHLMDLGAVSMADYYGDASLDNIGFVLLDLNGDNVDELVIGAVARADQQGNAIFCIYSDPQNPHYSINSVECDLYYLHSGEPDGPYALEITGFDRAWVIKPAESENVFDFYLREETLDPAGRMTLALTPFSQYK